MEVQFSANERGTDTDNNLAITIANGGSDVCGTDIIFVLETRGFSAASDIKESFLPSCSADRSNQECLGPSTPHSPY